MMRQVTFQTVKLGNGKHSSARDGVCVMELASMLTGEAFSDHPRSVCRVIAAFLRRPIDLKRHRQFREPAWSSGRELGQRPVLRDRGVDARQRPRVQRRKATGGLEDRVDKFIARGDATHPCCGHRHELHGATMAVADNVVCHAYDRYAVSHRPGRRVSPSGETDDSALVP
jgi:hypothetical protein